MKELISILPEILLLIILTSAFAILCLMLHKVFEQMLLFRGKLTILMAALIAALAVTGAAMLLVVPNNATEPRHTRIISVNYYLLPAVAVAGTVVLLQLFVIAATTTPHKTDEGSAKEPAKPKYRGRPKKEEAEDPLPAPKSRGKGKNKPETTAVGEAVPKTQNAS